MKLANQEIEKFRIRHGQMASDPSDGNNGAFRIFIGSHTVVVICSDGEGWEHVSVSLKSRCPTWEEMVVVKNLFWDDSETVIQYHPAKIAYVNNHPYCLHLWKPIEVEIPIPPTILVGMR